MIVMLKEVLYQISQSLEDSFLFNLAPVEDTVDSTDMGVVVVVDFNEGDGAVFTVSSLHYLKEYPSAQWLFSCTSPPSNFTSNLISLCFMLIFLTFYTPNELFTHQDEIHTVIMA
jgi:hypothetical protein